MATPPPFTEVNDYGSRTPWRISDSHGRTLDAVFVRTAHKHAISTVSMVRPGTRELWIGDVGWRTWEEIDRVPDPVAGPVRNIGWPCHEGGVRQSGYQAANLAL